MQKSDIKPGVTLRELATGLLSRVKQIHRGRVFLVWDDGKKRNSSRSLESVVKRFVIVDTASDGEQVQATGGFYAGSVGQISDIIDSKVYITSQDDTGRSKKFWVVPDQFQKCRDVKNVWDGPFFKT